MATEGFTSTTDLTETTKLLAEVVAETCKQLDLLKEERDSTTGEMKDAYNLVIQNKIWCLQRVIGDYWRKSCQLALDEYHKEAEKKTVTFNEVIDVSEDKSNAAAEVSTILQG